MTAVDRALRLEAIARRLRALEAAGACRRYAPAGERAVSAFERRAGVTLPAEYRTFVTTVADGIGRPVWRPEGGVEVEPPPHRGLLLPVGLATDSDGESYDFFAPEHATSGRRSSPALVGRAFPVDEALARRSFARASAARGGGGASTSEAQFALLVAAGRVDASARVDGPWGRWGTLDLANQGCGILALLVVTGPERGRVWADHRANDGGLCPAGSGDMAPDFCAWLEGELDELEAGSGGPARGAPPPGPAVRPARDDDGPF